jgi:hypothetical protein
MVPGLHRTLALMNSARETSREVRSGSPDNRTPLNSRHHH